ncbi:MAG: DUF6454 family protein [Actinomycetota bacterium]|nr:DUF6454 family protein [Actinomycetota bacterium]
MRSVGLRLLAGALLVLTLGVAAAGAGGRAPAPEVQPAAGAEQIVGAFTKLTRATDWQLVKKVPLRFDAHHPEGLVRLGDRFVLSTVEVTQPTQRYQPPGTFIDGTDRTPGAGIGHLISFDAEGNQLADKRLDDGADIYHPGGLDYDGEHIYVAVAEYRPARPSILYRVDPDSLAATEVLRTSDHIGGIVHDAQRGRLIGLNWGSRTAYSWSVRGRRARLRDTIVNPSHFIDYQDCKYVGRARRFPHPLMLCGGIAGLRHPGPDGQPLSYDLGGVALVDIDTMRPVWEVPFQQYTDKRQVATRNAIDVEVVDGRLRLYLVADDDDSNLLVYEAR